MDRDCESERGRLLEHDRLRGLAHSKYAMAILPRLPDLMACKTSGLRNALT